MIYGEHLSHGLLPQQERFRQRFRLPIGQPLPSGIYCSSFLRLYAAKVDVVVVAPPVAGPGQVQKIDGELSPLLGKGLEETPLQHLSPGLSFCVIRGRPLGKLQHQSYGEARGIRVGLAL